MLRYLASALLFGMLSLLGWVTQESHRVPNPKPPSPPNVFDRLEKQSTQSREEQLRQQAAVREQRRAKLAELDRDLLRLNELAQNLQKRLKAIDLDITLPADLSRQSQELERVARQIHKQIRAL